MTVRLIQCIPALLSRYRKFGIYFFLFIVLTLGLAAYVQRQAIYDQLYSWKLIPRPERLTELYFSEHTTLPASYTPGQRQTVQFTVRNLEYRTTSYAYRITQESQDGKTKQQLATGNFGLAHEHIRIIDAPIQLSGQGARSRVVVTITYDGIAFGQDLPSKQKQQIYYWVTEEGQRP